MCEYLFRHNLDLQNDPKNRFLVTSVSILHRFNSAYVQSVDLTHLHLEKLCYPQGIWYGLRLYNLAQSIANRRRLRSPRLIEDLFSFIEKIENPETAQPITTREIWSECKFLMVTGAGTPASVLAASLFYLTEYPRCYTILCEEIRSRFYDASDIKCGPELSSCAYLQACVKETLRMSPPVGGVLWREVEQPRIFIDGEYIPPGHDVGCGIYALHHNHEHFPDPFTFKPERWLNEACEIPLSQAYSAYTPFSMGPRGCLGRQLATMELQLTIATLLWTFDLRRPESVQGKCAPCMESVETKNYTHEFQQEDHIFSFFKGPYIDLRKRTI